MTEKRSDEDKGLGMPAWAAGLAWTQAMLDAPFRAHAGAAADSLRRLNAPVLESLDAQRKVGESLAKAAQQLASLAQQLEQLARQHVAAQEQARVALEPYLRYVEWLGEVGAGGEHP
jgi:hypothetical protein